MSRLSFSSSETLLDSSCFWVVTVASRVAIWSVYTVTFVVSSLICVEIFFISGFPSSSSRFRRISIDVTVLFVLFTMHVEDSLESGFVLGRHVGIV